MLKRLLDFIENRSPWQVLFPLLVIWLIASVTFKAHNVLVMDEVRYWGFAENLLQGHFHFTEGHNFLWSGPGYPLLLTPFVALDLPLWAPKMLNAVLLYIGIVHIFKTMSLFIPARKAWLGTLATAAYYPIYAVSLPFIMTEALTYMLVAMFAFHMCRVLKNKETNWRKMIVPGLLFTWLALTKVIFGYVLLSALIMVGAIWLWKRSNVKLASLTKILAFAMLFCMPYLIYTFALTGRAFYWSNAGGMQLYWMSSPWPYELGDWHGPSLTEHPRLKIHHGAFFDSIKDLDPLAKDDALKKKAIENIKANPRKYVYNWVSNISRTLFSYPLSYLRPSIGFLFYLLPNIFIIVLSVFAIYPSIRYHRRYPTEVLFLLLMAALYFGGISLVASYARFFYMIMPLLMIWLAVSLYQFVHLKIPDFNGTTVDP